MRLDLTPFLKLYAWWRGRQLARQDPEAAQRRTLLDLVETARDTQFGREHDFGAIRDVHDFQARVPLRRYDAIWERYLRPHYPVVENVIWPGRIPTFALSSGTTSGTTKYLPLTEEMRRSNIKASLDVMVHHITARPGTRFFGGKSFMLGGSTALTQEAAGVVSGDLSGIATKTLPRWAAPYAFPTGELALMSDWEEKVETLARLSLDEDIRVLTGTPSWVLILLERVRALRDGRGEAAGPLYPHLDLFIHGGVNFEPYRQRFLSLFKGQDIDMREVYPASEGFIASADRGYGEGLRLNLDHGLFFEFVPLEELESETPTRHWAATIEPGVNYAVVLSTCAGLFGYVLGDTVRFIETRPPRLLITGRTSYMLSAFGEHLIGEEIEHAVAEAAGAAGVDVTDFTVGALYPGDDRPRGRHLYIVELAEAAKGEVAAQLAAAIDRTLSLRNDDYRAHRSDGFGMDPPRVLLVPPGTFRDWMKARGKLGGQNKVARILNDASLWQTLQDFARARLDNGGRKDDAL